MPRKEPATRLDPRYSDPEATPTTWAEAREQLDTAELYWLSTVRPDQRPHVTPLLAVWLDEALHFCTGPEERKARNLAANPNCVLTTGANALDRGLDLVVEGPALPVTEETPLRRVAAAYEAKYGSDWHFDVHDGAFHHQGGRALVFQVSPATAFGFRKGTYGQTRWRF
ncbi:pyridoxamine 5'-phosphate oxidase [Streptomyces albus subsp. albus]|nr:pyridoxamine 5'-phosphate oxidase [Streptomyces albus subsp. albus]